MPESAPDPAAAAAAADEKHAADERIAEHNAKLAERLESTAQTVAGIAERVAQQQPAPAAPQAQQPVRVSEEQVAAAVERGEITQAQGLQILSRQYREDAKSEARREVQATLVEAGTHAATQHVGQLIGQYKQAVPGLAKRGSDDWNEAAQRFHELVREGYPNTIATELQALRELHGRDPSKAGSSGADPVRERTKERATRGQETTAPAARAPARTRRSSTEPDPDLSADHRTYVQRMIQIGQYKGWDDPKAVKYVSRAKSIADRKASA